MDRLSFQQAREEKERIELTALALEISAKLKLYDRVIVKEEK